MSDFLQFFIGILSGFGGITFYILMLSNIFDSKQQSLLKTNLISVGLFFAMCICWTVAAIFLK